MKSKAENEALLRNVRVVLAEAHVLEVTGHKDAADVFGRVAANALARYLATEEKRDRLNGSKVVCLNRELMLT